MRATCEVCNEPIYDDEPYAPMQGTPPKGIHKICPNEEKMKAKFRQLERFQF